MPYTQENRLIGIKTPLGEDVLLLNRLSGREQISHLFEFNLDLLSARSNLQFADIIGKNVTLRITQADDTPRYFNGVVARFAQSGSDTTFTHYHMELVPWLWLLTRSSDCRIFQNMSIPDILSQVFKDSGFSGYFTLSLTATYEPLEYCVQYRETAFNFVSRLMEQCGMFYFFQHSEDKHMLLIGDSGTVHQDCPGYQAIGYNLVAGGLDSDDVITTWNMAQELRTGKYSLNDYNFETPNTNLLASEATVINVGGNSRLEFYDYPGDYLNKSAGSGVAKTRMEEQEAGHLTIAGSGVCRGFTSGYKFTLKDHYREDLNISYLLTDIRHTASVGESYTRAADSGRDEDSTGATYENTFNCIPASVPFRPARITPKPFVQGPQTAVVVGKSGEEIWVDKYGRVKVQFYWDRVGTKDENSSCWVRVSQPWAGKAWGAISMPRMGQEVIVSFLEGDPDRPIITGRVYNADQVVPYALPDEQTRSTFMSRSSKGGGSSNYNEIRFEDKKGNEQLFINAEKDMDHRTENDLRQYVGNDHSLIVKGKQAEKVQGDFHNQIVGSAATKVGEDLSLQVGQNLYEKSGANFAHEAGEVIHLKAGMKVVLEAGVELTLKASGNFIDIGPAGIAISGTMVMINSGGSAGSGCGSSPVDPKDPDVADDGTKGNKMN